MLGLKCPPALVAFGSEQSPFSWMWTPCSPGVAPCTSTWTATPSPAWVKRALPEVVLSLRDSSVAMAAAPPPPAGAAPELPLAAGDVEDEVAQAQIRIVSSEATRI